MRPPTPSAARSRGPRLWVGGRSARPRYALLALRALTTVVVGGGGAEAFDQPLISPVAEVSVNRFSLNRKFAGAVLPPWVTTNFLVVLKTMPVGESAFTSSGILVTVGSAGVAPRYRVELLLAWLATQSGVCGPKSMPHGFFTSGSVSCASPGRSET